MPAPARAAARWNLPIADHSIIEALSRELRVERVVAAVLIQRGYTDPAAARDPKRCAAERTPKAAQESRWS